MIAFRLGREKPAIAIIKLALPMMLGMIAQMIYNMTDTFFIGQTGDPNMVAGISLAMPLFIVSQGLGNIFGVGTSSYISRLLGARKDKDAKRTCAAAFIPNFGNGDFYDGGAAATQKPHSPCQRHKRNYICVCR
jgi:Na+-driven multidrug efflux pump